MRVVVISTSPPLEQLLSYLSAKGIDIEVVDEGTNTEAIKTALVDRQAEWVFVVAETAQRLRHELTELVSDHENVGVVALAEDGEHVALLEAANRRKEAEQGVEAYWSQLSLSEFVDFLAEEFIRSNSVPRITDIDQK